MLQVYTIYVLLYLSNPTAALNGLSGLQNPNPGVFCLTQKTIWKTSYPANRTAFTNRKKNKVLTGFFFLIPRLLEWYAIVKGGQSLYHPNNSERPSSSLNAPFLASPSPPFLFSSHDTNERRGRLGWVLTSRFPFFATPSTFSLHPFPPPDRRAGGQTGGDRRRTSIQRN